MGPNTLLGILEVVDLGDMVVVEGRRRTSVVHGVFGGSAGPVCLKWVRLERFV